MKDILRIGIVVAVIAVITIGFTAISIFVQDQTRTIESQQMLIDSLAWQRDEWKAIATECRDLKR